jgi:general secretion pathway protein D
VTNSLLVRATAQDWAVIQQAIQSLDLRPLAVVIEVIIAEVRRNDELNLGTSFSAIGGNDDDDVAVDLPGVQSTDAFTITYVHTGDINVEATLAALSATGNLRIISRPIIQAQNNQEARILVGTEQPFVAIQRSLPTDVPQFDQVVQYREVGTALTITPTINDEGYVNLAVTQEVSSVTNETQFDAPVISTREAITQILARNGQTVAIGGLVDRQRERLRAGIPLLKDIPILGYLFGTTREFDSTSELFLFLTPYIVASDEDADRLKQELEQNADLLRGVVPIPPILPRVIRPPTPPDTSGMLAPDTVPFIRRDTLSVVR